MSIQIDISVGELLDKITILQIKQERMDDAAKLENVKKELHVLQKKYIHNFLRKVTNSPLKTLQISTLQKELSKLPKNHYATRFQEVLQKELPYDLVDQIGPNGIFQSF